MPKLIMTYGLPACGKSTWSRQYQADHLNVKRVNRDDLRLMLDDGKFSKENEEIIRSIRNITISNALLRGYDVICDDTNLAPKNEIELRALTKNSKAEFEIKDFTHIPLEECIARDKKRANYVGEKVIRQMWRRYLAPKIESPAFDAGLPNCYIFDLDGTLAKFNGRGAYEWDKVGTDVPNYPVVGIYNKLRATQETEQFFIVSGRDAVCREDTAKWCEKNEILYDKLLMRKQGDMRDDVIVKRELYEQHIKGKYNVEAIFDDRAKVVSAWRDLGLTCLQVAEGDF